MTTAWKMNNKEGQHRYVNTAREPNAKLQNMLPGYKKITYLTQVSPSITAD